MVEGQDPCHNRGSRAGERSRLGVKVGAKVESSSGEGQGRGAWSGSRCWSPRGSRA